MNWSASLKEFGPKLGPAARQETQEAIVELRQALEGGDIEEFNRRKEELTRVAHILAEKLYRQANAGTPHQGNSNAGESVDAEIKETG